MRPAQVVPVVLAACASSRMGRPKALLRFGATSALGRVLEACAEAGLAPARVVVGAAPLPVPPPALALPNPRWAEGRTSSLQVGLAALPADAEGWLLWPVDVCLPGAALLRALLAAAAARPAALAWVPSHDGRRGHPVLFARAAAARFQALSADQPAREVVRALAAEGLLEHVPWPERGVLLDLNTPEDYQAALEELRRSGEASEA